MVLEVAILDVIPEKTADFEVTFAKAQSIIASMTGYIALATLLRTPRIALMLGGQAKWVAVLS